MLIGREYQLVGLPVTHAMGLALWSLFAPHGGLTPLAWWLLWVPVLWLLFRPRVVALVFLGSLPFLITHGINAAP